MAQSLAIGQACGAERCAQRAPPAFSWPEPAARSPGQELPALQPGCRFQGHDALWRAVDIDLSAVIGPRGTAAVLRRALAMTRRTHAWMPAPPDHAGFDACVCALSAAMSGQHPEESRAGRQALEATFHELLSALVGATLTTQLLRAAWGAQRAKGAPMP